EGVRLHRFMMFEDAVQADHGDVRGREGVVDSCGLRDTMHDAPGAQHLKGVQYHNAPSEPLQGKRVYGVEPLRDSELWGRLRGHEVAATIKMQERHGHSFLEVLRAFGR